MDRYGRIATSKNEATKAQLIDDLNEILRRVTNDELNDPERIRKSDILLMTYALQQLLDRIDHHEGNRCPLCNVPVARGIGHVCGETG